MDPARYILAVLFVTALLLGAIWWLRRMNLAGVDRRSGLRIIAAQSIGTRERLLVVRFGQEDVLIGVTAHSITRLGSTPIEAAESTRSAAEGD